MHSLLKRQLQRIFGDISPDSPEWQRFIDMVNNAYLQSDADRRMLERSLDLSSQELLQANSDFRAVFERVITSSVDGIFAYDREFRLTVWNPGMERITDFRRDEAVNRNVFEIFPQNRDSGEDQLIRESLHGKTSLSKESSYVIKETGETGYFESHFSPLRSEGGEVIGGLAIIRDITERKMAEQALAERAIRDSLTNLYNRGYFDYRIAEEISWAQRDQYTLAILLCDVDRFKEVNDERGHQFGDEVLKQVAAGIQDSIRGIDLVFRWGGDEFVVVMPARSRQGIVTTAKRIRRGVSQVSQKVQCNLDLSLGISLFPEHGTDIDELIRLADRALYIAKMRGDKIHIGEDEYQLDEHAVEVEFQPIVNVSTGQILGHEALTRDAQGRLSVHELFRKYEMIGQLDDLKQICFRKQLHTAQRMGLKRVFINVDFELLERLGHLERPKGLEVIFEISEKEALRDVGNHLKTAKKWRGKGFKFAIDDFGAGFISLPFIAELIPDYIKVDRSAILQAVSSKKFRGFLKHLVLALRDYSKKGVIAEGIENQKELRLARSINIHLVQGFLLGKPRVFTEPPAKEDPLSIQSA